MKLTRGTGAVGGRVHRQADHTRRHDQLPLDSRRIRTLQDNDTWALPHDRTEERVEYYGAGPRIHGLCYLRELRRICQRRLQQGGSRRVLHRFPKV